MGENKCGACRLCCTVMRVEGFTPPEQDKPQGVTCKFVCSTGCSIYDQRPDSCQGFECVWLASQRWPHVAFPNQERPDRTNVVMEVNSKGTVIVHCKTPEAWRDKRVMKRITKLNDNPETNVTIEHGDGRVSVLEKNGSVTPMRFIGLDPATNERKYVRER